MDRDASNSPLSVLVVEASLTSQMVIAKILERLGHATELASDADAALDAVERCRFDLVLIDVDNHEINGIDTVKLYRFMSLGEPRVPVVAMSGKASPHFWARCREAGIDDCLQKPIGPRQLSESINKAISKCAIARRN